MDRRRPSIDQPVVDPAQAFIQDVAAVHQLAIEIRIREIAIAYPRVRDLHDLRTRSSGQATFIQFHLELDGQMSLLEAHEVSDKVEDAILVEFPGAEIIIHEDPAGVPERRRQFA